MSKNQELFVQDAEEQGLNVDMDYSGRGMYGKTCPSVYVSSESDFVTESNYHVDSMGKGLVLYARS